MIDSLMQFAGEVTRQANAFHVIELLGFSGLGLMLWRFTIKVAEKIEGLRGNVRALDATMRGHMDNTPTLSTCAENILMLKNVIRDENRQLRDEMTAMGINRNHAAADVEQRVRDVERWQDRESGRQESAE